MPLTAIPFMFFSHRVGIYHGPQPRCLTWPRQESPLSVASIIYLHVINRSSWSKFQPQPAHRTAHNKGIDLRAFAVYVSTIPMYSTSKLVRSEEPSAQFLSSSNTIQTPEFQHWQFRTYFVLTGHDSDSPKQTRHLINKCLSRRYKRYHKIVNASRPVKTLHPV